MTLESLLLVVELHKWELIVEEGWQFFSTGSVIWLSEDIVVAFVFFSNFLRCSNIGENSLNDQQMHDKHPLTDNNE